MFMYVSNIRIFRNKITAKCTKASKIFGFFKINFCPKVSKMDTFGHIGGFGRVHLYVFKREFRSNIEPLQDVLDSGTAEPVYYVEATDRCSGRN